MLKMYRNLILSLLLLVAMLASGTPFAVSHTHAQSNNPNLLTNPGFEEPVEDVVAIPGWNLNGGASALKPGITVNVTEGISTSGANSLLVKDDSTTAAIVVYSDAIEVSANQKYTFQAQAKDTSGTIYAAVRFYKKASDNVISGYLPKPTFVAMSPSQLWNEVTFDITAPEDASYARVLFYTTSATKGSARFDDVYFGVAGNNGGGIMYELNDLGSMVHTVNTHRAAFGPDANGNMLAYSTMVGIPAKLLVFDVKTEKLLAEIPVEDTVNGTKYSTTYLRGLVVQPDGTVYISGTPSYLYKYTPGDDHVQFLKKAVGSQIFDMKSGPGGILIGGTYNKSEAFEYNIASGELTNLGPVMPNESYSYSVAYDAERNDTYYGIGSHAHLIKYDRDTQTKTEIPVPAKFAGSNFIYDMTVSGGKLFMRFSPGGTIAMDLATGQFDETDGNVQSRHVSQASPIDGKIYYSTSGYKLGFYDPQTKQYSTLDVATGGDLYGFSFISLGSPDYPGLSLVGMTQEGRMFKYNPVTGASKVVNFAIEGEPTELQTVAKSLDGRMQVSGYLSGGNAIYDPVTGQKEEYTDLTLGQGQQLPSTQTDRIFSYKDRVFYVNYTGMNVYEYDPYRPWNRRILSRTPSFCLPPVMSAIRIEALQAPLWRVRASL